MTAPRHIHFESVPNFRDLGGYRTHDGRTVAWRRLFRSAALHKMNDHDMARLKQEISPRAVIDLRRLRDPEQNPEALLLKEVGARYYPIPLRPDSSSYLKEEEKGSADGYLRANGADSSLVDRLKAALLV